MHSYRVGAITRANPACCSYFGSLCNAFIIGSKNDNVFPLPVSDRQSMSPYFKLQLKAIDCIFVGFSYPDYFRTRSMSASRLKSEKFFCSSYSCSSIIVPFNITGLLFSIGLKIDCLTFLLSLTNYYSSSSNKFFFLRVLFGSVVLLIINSKLQYLLYNFTYLQLTLAMIIKTFLRASSGKAYPFNKATLNFQFSSKTDLSTQLRVDLVQKLENMKIRTSKSIFIEELSEDIIVQEDGEKITEPKKINKYSFRTLTKQQKAQLGLMIPSSPFPLRMTRKVENQYRPSLCQNLYSAQKQNLPASIRILQLQKQKINIDQYINSTYKDIFSRYMVSRGLGIQWQANHSSYGVMNPTDNSQQSIQKQMKDFYKWIIDLIKEYPIKNKQILGFYSYANKKYVQADKTEVENIFKIGYFFTMPLTKFGRYKQSFGVLQERNQKIQILVMAEDPLKLLNIQALCIEPHKKMIILQRYQVEQNSYKSDDDPSKISSYLITSMDVYTSHKDYFTQNGYTKHSIFDSDHLLEMEAGDGIKFLNQIQGYSRKGGIYIIDRYSSLPDYQRSLHYQLEPKNSYIEQTGKINLPYEKKQDFKIYITDPKYQQKILDRLSQLNIKATKIDLYSTYQDQIYSQNNQKLHFRTARKFVIQIPQIHKQQLAEALKKSIVVESKVKVPKLNRHYPKPRDKRRHKKQIRSLDEQKTEYLSLQDSLNSIDELSFSTIFQQDHNLTLPIFVQSITSNNIQQQLILINPKIKEILQESIIINVQNSHKQSDYLRNALINWDHEKLNKYVQQLNHNRKLQDGKIRVKYIHLTENLLNGYRCFKNYAQRPQLSNVVIEPQSKTQDIVPYFFHLNLMLHKMLAKQSIQKQKGRRVRHANKLYNEYTNKLFSLIKFHSTIEESQRHRNVDEVLFGVLKANKEQQYGYGLEALRLWVARNDWYLGDRKLIDKDVNKQLQLAAFIRKMYWEILPLLNVNLDKIVVDDSENKIEIQSIGSRTVPREKLSYLHNFILDHMNYYILNMEECYKKLELTKALQLTEDFFKNYLEEIFVKTVRKRIITYPLSQQTKQHVYVLKKIIDLLAVVAPLLPYSAYHISKLPMLNWPEVDIKNVRPQLIQNYNRMTKLRVEVKNKFLLNNFHHSQLVIPLNKQDQDNDSQIKDVPDIWRLGKQDLQLFFDIENISIKQPQEQGKSFKLKLTHNHPLGEIPAIKFYEYKQVCIRCSPKRNYGTHLCQKCLDYLNNNFGKRLPLNSS